MNPRIKELAKQANIPDYNLEYGTELCIAPHLQKFAESLIKECIKMVEGVEPSYKDYRSQIEESMQSEIVFVLKENFGIEG
jgi:hypothetical protein